ncbi:hypothetical protein SAMN05444921_124124 [Streptomyces wuyuanensis]|uniref:Uncharacterized protein n=1 Tax=Streptomyces wuyuanensis TaxID=1196353 RepID=A0A1H0ALL5_9ACTN|nr:hypothetical protein SAMN05444921_124124 [Streptomyces wuyuanensis]
MLSARPGNDRYSLRPEATEVMRCLRAGETESPLVPLDGTLAVMRTLDAVRDRVGVRYPQEAGNPEGVGYLPDQGRGPVPAGGPVPPAGRGRHPGHTCSRPGLPASVTKDAAVETGAPGVVTAETVRKSARARSLVSVTVT